MLGLWSNLFGDYLFLLNSASLKVGLMLHCAKNYFFKQMHALLQYHIAANTKWVGVSPAPTLKLGKAEKLQVHMKGAVRRFGFWLCLFVRLVEGLLKKV